jgi:hypothetical protein
MSAHKEDFLNEVDVEEISQKNFLNEVDVEEISQEDFLNDSVTKWYYFYEKKKELSFECKKNKVTFAYMVQERIFRSTDPPSILKCRGEKRKRISFTDESSGGM